MTCAKWRNTISRGVYTLLRPSPEGQNALTWAKLKNTISRGEKLLTLVYFPPLTGDTMRTMTAKEAHSHVRELLDAAIAGQPVVLTRNGKTVAIVVPAAFLTIGRDLPADDKQTVPA